MAWHERPLTVEDMQARDDKGIGFSDVVEVDEKGMERRTMITFSDRLIQSLTEAVATQGGKEG